MKVLGRKDVEQKMYNLRKKSTLWVINKYDQQDYSQRA